jgi:SAM-dependent methyltransferase
MADDRTVAQHYTHGDLLGSIRSGIRALGKNETAITVEDLGPVDEFHIGGRRASEDFLNQLALMPTTHLLDVGCGLGGAARFAAKRYGCKVTGIDLTGEFIAAGQVMSGWVGLGHLVSLQQGSALSMPFRDHTFDSAYMLHVGMNIADKSTLADEVHRVLKPGALFGIYDVMRVRPGDLQYPVPWAASLDADAATSPDDYKSALKEAGFTVVGERNRRDFALAFFDDLRSKASAKGGPPPLGLHILMGETASLKVQNMIANISAGRIAPVEIIARRA